MTSKGVEVGKKEIDHCQKKKREREWEEEWVLRGEQREGAEEPQRSCDANPLLTSRTEDKHCTVHSGMAGGGSPSEVTPKQANRVKRIQIESLWVLQSPVATTVSLHQKRTTQLNHCRQNYKGPASLEIGIKILMK